jgi:hypothetical protein
MLSRHRMYTGSSAAEGTLKSSPVNPAVDESSAAAGGERCSDPSGTACWVGLQAHRSMVQS